MANDLAGSKKIDISEHNLSNIFACAWDWAKCVTWPNIHQLKQENIREYTLSDIPRFSNLTSTAIEVFVSNLIQD